MRIGLLLSLALALTPTFALAEEAPSRQDIILPGLLDLPVVVGKRFDPCWRDWKGKPIEDPLVVCVEIPWDDFHGTIQAYWKVLKADGWGSVEVYDDFFGYTFRRFMDETTCQELHIGSVMRGVPDLKPTKTDVLEFRARRPDRCRRRSS